MTTEEIWVELEGFSRYLVSNHGRVKNVLTDKLLKPSIKTDGQRAVGLVGDRAQVRTFRLPNIVWEFFGSGDPEGMSFGHIDGDPSNNAIWNLELVPRVREQVRIRHNNSGAIYPTIASAARAFGGIPAVRLAYAVRAGKSINGHMFEII